VKFLIDMPLSPELASWLTQKGHDAIHSFHAGLAFSADEAILEYARKEQRLLVTADLDFPRLLALMKAEGPGLILFRGGNYGEHESIERLGRALEMIPSQELPRSIIVIEKGRIRRRYLPL
jgi:predicted nuclease of predicted toxin-antitoxin system